DGRQPVAPAVEPGARGRDDFGMLGQPQVIVGAKIEHVPAVLHPHSRPLGAREDPLRFVETRLPDLLQLARQVLLKGVIHARARSSVRAERLWCGPHSFGLHSRITLPDWPDIMTANACSYSV